MPFEEFKTLKRMLQEWTQMLKLAATGHGNESLWIGSTEQLKDRACMTFATFPPNSSPFPTLLWFSWCWRSCVFQLWGIHLPAISFLLDSWQVYLHWLGYVCSFLTLLVVRRSVVSDFVKLFRRLSLVSHGLQYARLPVLSSLSLKVNSLFTDWNLLHWKEMASAERITSVQRAPSLSIGSVQQTVSVELVVPRLFDFSVSLLESRLLFLCPWALARWTVLWPGSGSIVALCSPFCPAWTLGACPLSQWLEITFLS